MEKINEEKIFDIIYSKGFDERQTNQLLKLYSDGYDLTYIEPTIPSDILRNLRNYLNKCENDIKNIYIGAINKKQNIISFIGLDFTPEQISKTLKLEEKEINTKYLKRNGFSDKQFNILYEALSQNYDISWFANPNISNEKMRIAFKGLKNSINLSKYIEKYNEKQCEILLEALHFSHTNFPINISFLENENLTHDQMQFILSGLKQKLDVSKYANPKYDSKKMAVILLFLRDGFNVDWINEKHTAAQLFEYHEIMKIDCNFIKKLYHEEYNAGQLSFIKEALKNNRDVNSILNPRYSIERMNLILSSNDEIYKDLTISDERLHLYKYGYIKKNDEEYDIKEISKKIAFSIKNCMYVDEPFDMIISPYSESTYFTNGNEILEVLCISDKILEEMLYNLEYKHYMINYFGTNEALYILRENEKNAINLLNKLNILKFNEETETIERFDLFSGKLINTKTFDMEKILTIETYEDYFNTSKFYTEPSDMMNNIIMILNYLNINIERYYLIDDVFNSESRPCLRLCINLEKIKQMSGNIEENIKELKKEMHAQVWEMESRINEESYIINMYNNKGRLIDSDNMVFFKDEIEYLLKEEYQDFYETFALNLEECIRQIEKNDFFDR